MNKILLTSAIAAVLALTSCGGHSGATGEQIDKAKEEAREMLNNTSHRAAQPQPEKQAETQKTSTAEAQNVAPADTLPE